MAPLKKKAETRLAETRDAHADTLRQIGVLEAQRNAALLADDDATAAKLYAELETLRGLARGHADKVALLTAEAAREEAEAVVKRQEGLIVRVEDKMAARLAAARKVAKIVASLEPAYRELISLSEEIAPAWNWSIVDRNVIMTTGGAIQAQLGHEFFRISHKPFLGGSPGLRAEVSLPGSKCSRPVDWLGFPEREPALVDVIKAANEHGSKLMRSGKLAQPESLTPSTPPPSPASPPSPPSPPAASGNGGGAPDPVPTADLATLAALLKRQAELSMDMTPAGEAAYQQVVAEIAALS